MKARRRCPEALSEALSEALGKMFEGLKPCAAPSSKSAVARRSPAPVAKRAGKG